MRLLLACAASLFIVGCESTLPPLETVQPTFSYVRDTSPDTVIVRASELDENDNDRSAAVAIVNE